MKGKQGTKSLDIIHSHYVASSLRGDTVILGRNADSCTLEMMPKFLRRKTLGHMPNRILHLRWQRLMEQMWTTGLLRPLTPGLPHRLAAARVATLCQVTAAWKTDVAFFIQQICPQWMTSPETLITQNPFQRWQR